MTRLADPEMFETLMREIGKSADPGTRVVLASYARKLPPAALGKVIETVRAQQPSKRAKYANGALRSEIEERAA